MAGGEPERSGRGRRRAGETRKLLIDACVRLIREEGLTSLSVQRVTRAAGISPPGFYKHFANTDELQSAAVAAVLGAIAERGALAKVLERFDIRDGLPSDAVGREIMGQLLDVGLSEPRFADLYLRYRNDPTMVGGAIHAVAERVRDETIAFMWRQSRQLGAQPEDYPRAATYAEYSLALYYQACEMLQSGRYSRKLVVERLYASWAALTRFMIDEQRALGAERER